MHEWEQRWTLYLVMALWIHVTREVWDGAFGPLVMILAGLAAWGVTTYAKN